MSKGKAVFAIHSQNKIANYFIKTSLARPYEINHFTILQSILIQNCRLYVKKNICPSYCVPLPTLQNETK